MRMTHPRHQSLEPPAQPIILTIRLFPNGSITVDGPIQNKMLSYGLLEMARDLIKDYKIPMVQPAVGVDIGVPKGDNGT